MTKKQREDLWATRALVELPCKHKDPATGVTRAWTAYNIMVAGVPVGRLNSWGQWEAAAADPEMPSAAEAKASEETYYKNQFLSGWHDAAIQAKEDS